MNEQIDLAEFERLETEYQNQFPEAENPFDWFAMVPLEKLIDFVAKRKGRKVILTENMDAFDDGVLSYG